MKRALANPSLQRNGMLVPIIALASALDGITFAMAMSVVPAGYEANPLARVLMEWGGIAATLGGKAVATVVLVAIAYRVRSHRTHHPG